MKIGIVGRWDPKDKKSWSGTGYYTRREISKYYEVEDFYFPLPRWLREWLTTQKSINRRWFGKHTAVEFLTSYARYFSNALDKALEKRPVDLLFVLSSPQLIAYSKTKLPLIQVNDATFFQLQGYYPYFSNLANYNIKCGIDMDKLTYLRADHSMLASEWCRQSAITDYGVDPAKISVVPLGANLDTEPDASLAAQPRGAICKLLFLGVEWDRKGGDIALETYRLLKAKGLPVTLTIIGCTPPVPVDEGVTVIPFINKNDPKEAAELFTLLAGSSFLLLPTRAECAGLVFCEAAAFGIPSITTDTGGVRTYVTEGINGFALPLSAGPADYAGRIENCWNDAAGYEELRRNSRRQYEEQLNWIKWGQRFAAIATGLIH
ncbi:MAG: glycosyltransferase [Ferruginibacter sp.]